MKLVYLIAGTYRAAGMERALAIKANWLAAHGYEILIVTTDQKGRRAAFSMDPSIRTLDLAIGYEDNNGGSFLDKFLRFPFKRMKHKRRLRSILKREHADIVVSMFCNDASFLPSIKDGSRKVLEIHFSRFKRLQYARRGMWALADRLRTRTDLCTVRKYDRFVVLTHEDAGYWGGLPNISVIPNPRTFSCETPSELENRQAMAIGRYTPQKGFDLLMDAWRKADTKGWRLRLAGEGELEDAGIRGILPENVIAGPSKDVKSELLESSFLIMSSRYEGLPMALLEAQAAGLPVASFACKCGPRDIITDGQDGILVPEGDTDALAEAIGLLVSDESLRKRMGALAFANSDKYDIENIMPLWEKLFAELS
ncbi:MAG: glycosyltransferase family 4 protein [Bacteroidales bacterium]|nr:glycosyltransferase family 4 protein [Bacteroidales bacterium]